MYRITGRLTVGFPWITSPWNELSNLLISIKKILMGDSLFELNYDSYLVFPFNLRI